MTHCVVAFSEKVPLLAQVQQLDTFHDTLEDETPIRGRKHDVKIIQALILSTRLRNRREFKDALGGSLHLLFPGIDLARASMRCPSATVLQRSQLFCDAALCCYMVRWFARQSGVAPSVATQPNPTVPL